MKTVKHIFFDSRISLSLLFIVFSLMVNAQNASLNNALLVTDHIQIVEQDYPERHRKYQGIDNLENLNPGKYDLVNIIADAFESGNVQALQFDVFFDSEFPNNYSSETETIDVNTDSLKDQIRSIVFIEEWKFDTLSFAFNKDVKGFIPIRHTVQDLEPDAQKLELTALFRLPDQYSRKEKRSIQKRMVAVKKIAYEFVFTEPHLLFLQGADESVIRELGHAAYKYYNINWNRKASNDLVEGIIDRSFKEEQQVYALDGQREFDLDSLPYITDPYLDNMLSDIMNEYKLEYAFPSISEIKYDLKQNIFSVIFFEDWYIDPETLYFRKQVNEIAPVLWQRRKTADGTPLDDPDSGLPVYYKSILYRIPFNTN